MQRAKQSTEKLGEALSPFGAEAPVQEEVMKASDVGHIAAPDEIGLDGKDMRYTLKAMKVVM